MLWRGETASGKQEGNFGHGWKTDGRGQRWGSAGASPYPSYGRSIWEATAEPWPTKSAANPNFFIFFGQIAYRGLGAARHLWQNRTGMETKGKCGVRHPVRRGEPPRPQRRLNLERGVQDGGKSAAFKFLTVRNLNRRSWRWATLGFGGSWNSVFRLKRQGRAWVILDNRQSCKMHEMA